jgi:hypothetical protein
VGADLIFHLCRFGVILELARMILGELFVRDLGSSSPYRRMTASESQPGRKIAVLLNRPNL